MIGVGTKSVQMYILLGGLKLMDIILWGKTNNWYFWLYQKGIFHTNLNSYVLPLARKWDTPTNHNRWSFQKNKKKERVDFSGLTIGLNQSHAAGQIKGSLQYCRIANHLPHLWIHFFCQPHVLLRSSVNPAATIVGGNWGESRVLAALSNIPCPDRPSGACSASPLDQTCRRVTGTSWISSLLLRGMVPC